MTVTKYVFSIQHLIIHAICHSKIWCGKEQKIHTWSLWDFFVFVYFTTIFFFFWPRRDKFLELFTMLSIVKFLISDCDVQFICETHSIIIENAKKSVDFICLLKMIFGEADFAQTLIPDDYWVIAVADVSTKHSNWMQQSDTRREGNLDQPEKKSYSQIEKNFQFFQNRGEM